MGLAVRVNRGIDTVLEHSLEEVMAKQLACHVVSVEVAQDWYSWGEDIRPLLEDSAEVLKFDQPALVALLGGFLIMVNSVNRK